jgi:hypothetical protein
MNRIGTYTQSASYAIMLKTTFGHVRKNSDYYLRYHYVEYNGDLVGSIADDLDYILGRSPECTIYILDAPHEDGDMQLETDHG